MPVKNRQRQRLTFYLQQKRIGNTLLWVNPYVTPGISHCRRKTQAHPLLTRLSIFDVVTDRFHEINIGLFQLLDLVRRRAAHLQRVDDLRFDEKTLGQNPR